jgi:glycosyltransferase 2 family protein
MKRFVRRAIVAMLLGVLLYGAFVAYTGWHRIEQSVASFQWSAFALALALASSNYLLRFLKWEYYLARLGIGDVPKLDSALVFLSGFVLTITPGKVGEVFKSAVLAETHGVPAARTAPIVIAERLTDVIGVIALIAIGSAGFSGGLPWALAATALVLIGMLFVVWRRPGELFLAWAERGPERMRGLAPKLRDAFDSLRIVASPAALFWPSLLSLVGWACEGTALWVILRGFGESAALPLAIFFFSTATLAGAIVPVPGGLGVAEAMIQEQLVHIGRIEPGAATASMILIRFATLWWAVLVGFGALALLRARFPSLMRG